MVRSNEDIYEALKEICERHLVRRLDLHGSGLTGDNLPDEQDELNLLVEFQPLSETEHAKMCLALEKALDNLFGRKVGLLATDDIKHEWLRSVLTRRRTLLYSADGRDES